MDKGREYRVARYFFNIRLNDREDSDLRGVSLPNDAAVLDHALCIIKSLRLGGEHNDPALLMIVKKRQPETGTVIAVPCGLCLMPRVISKANEYRANAAECRRRAKCAVNAPEKHMWRDMSESWLAMIGFAEREDFSTAEHERGTNQQHSKSSH